MTTPAAQRKAAERARHKEAGRVAVTVHSYPEDRELVARYVKRLNERAERRRAGMFRDEPQATCMQHTARRDMTVAEVIDDLAAMRCRGEMWVCPKTPNVI